MRRQVQHLELEVQRLAIFNRITAWIAGFLATAAMTVVTGIVVAVSTRK